MACVRRIADGIDLDVWVVPRAAKPGLGPLRGERLRAAVSAPPVDGAANEAVRDLVATAFRVARSQVSVVRGLTGRQKTLRILGAIEALLASAESLCAAKETL